MEKIKNKKNIMKLIILLILLYNIIWILYNFTLAKKVAKYSIYEYLETMNINKEKIKTLEIKYDFKRGNLYIITIKYKDKPNIKYEYSYMTKKMKLRLISDLVYQNQDLDFKIIDKKKFKIIDKEEFKIIEMKYSFLDYIKDIKKDIVN